MHNERTLLSPLPTNEYIETMCISNLGKCKYSHGQWKFYATKQTFIKSLILLEKAHISLSWLLARNNHLLSLLTTYLKK